MSLTPNCCPRAAALIETRLKGDCVAYSLYCDAAREELAYCPFCGKWLRPDRGDERDRLYVTFDVDGVLCDDSDPTAAYRDRKPYPWVRSRLEAIKAEGHLITLQTARYMRHTSGDQAGSHKLGYVELVDWLSRHGIPHDRVYFGKASSDIFVDDRAHHLNSNEGQGGWDRLAARLHQLSTEKKSKR